MTEPFPPKVGVPRDLYLSLIQMQTDYYATQGNAGPEWSRRAEATVACAFCPVDSNSCPGHIASDSDPKVCRHCGTHISEEAPDPLDCIVDRWIRADEQAMARALEKDDAEARNGDPFR